IENAIKHNVISRKNPLRIKLYTDQMDIIVNNNLQEKAVKEPSTMMGLKNIQRRYGFLTDRQVIIKRTDTTFTVKIPLLQFDP
ncbi:MAG TPA: histidine kinase, partial [Chryseolinea sp.]